MEIKEQVMEALKNISTVAEEPIFSQEEYAVFKRCGMSDEEIKQMEQAELMSGVVDVLPDNEADVQRLAAALGAISNVKDTAQNLVNLKLIAERDPQMLVKLMALTAVAENEADVK